MDENVIRIVTSSSDRVLLFWFFGEKFMALCFNQGFYSNETQRHLKIFDFISTKLSKSPDITHPNLQSTLRSIGIIRTNPKRFALFIEDYYEETSRTNFLQGQIVGLKEKLMEEQDLNYEYVRIEQNRYVKVPIRTLVVCAAPDNQIQEFEQQKQQIEAECQHQIDKIAKLIEEKLPEKCAWCSKATKQSCSGCHAVNYCSRECQKSDWPKRHNVLCKQIQTHQLSRNNK